MTTHILTGPHSDMVQWRSQGGPVQFLMFGGLAIGSHGLVSSEHRTSRVTWALRPHLAGHWMEEQRDYVIYCLEEFIRDGSYLSPLCHLPLWAAGRALTGSPLYRPLQVGQGAEFAID